MKFDNETPDQNQEPLPAISAHQHTHKFVIPSNEIFDFSSDIKVIRSTMYEPVLDRCVTTTVIKPSKHPIEEFSINGYGDHDQNDPEPPDKPPRRQARPLEHRKSRQELESEEGNSILGNKCYKRPFSNEYFKHERSRASECLINECLEEFINALHTMLFLRTPKITLTTCYSC
ncbi:unnamed protein product [Phaedon cochleariae]|uniref:Uncharacterized protein n=1 Tax=Phaedon cochleariae TaxID=80249 RepID=A0A9P0DJB5_PHACE|nr:unnamed protein product [Phaedon cochleariae]